MFYELRLAGDWMSTTGLVARVLDRLPDGHPFDPEVVRLCMRKRFGALSRKGLVDRRNAGISAAGTYDGSTETNWRLAAVATNDASSI
jgi:hypothetical protein